MSQSLETGGSINNKTSSHSRSREYRAELSKNIAEIVIEKATDGNKECFEIYQKARRMVAG